MPFPIDRPRRLRRTRELRRLTREVSIAADNLVQPLFIVEGRDIKRAIDSLPGQFHLSPDQAALEAERIFQAKVPAVLLFGVPSHKDATGSSAWDNEGAVQHATRLIKKSVPDLLVLTDVCLCEYTDHGHCGIIRDGEVDNDSTLPLLAKTAVSHARAGADIVAPSDMMDGRVSAIRKALDADGYESVAILSYAAKYCSAFYGPFRDAAGSAPAFGDRRGYQMDPANRLEALREVKLDIEEGADIVMVKPALPYLDVIRDVKLQFGRTTAAYQVSGEYAMIEAAAKAGAIDRTRAICESLIAIRRAGADFIMTYWAAEVAGWIREDRFEW